MTARAELVRHCEQTAIQVLASIQPDSDRARLGDLAHLERLAPLCASVQRPIRPVVERMLGLLGARDSQADRETRSALRNMLAAERARDLVDRAQPVPAPKQPERGPPLARDVTAELQENSLLIVSGHGSEVRRGAGFIISEGDRARPALVVTSVGLVRDAREAMVYQHGHDQPKAATVRNIDRDRDLVFLEVAGLNGDALPLTTATPHLGEDLSSVHFASPGDANADGRNPGIVRGPYLGAVRNAVPLSADSQIGVTQFQHDIHPAPAIAGSPIVDLCGRVVGLGLPARALSEPRQASPYARGFALAGSEIIKAAEDRGIRITIDDADCDRQPPAVSAAPGDSADEIGFFAVRSGQRVLIGLIILMIVLGAGLAITRWWKRRSAASND